MHTPATIKVGNRYLYPNPEPRSAEDNSRGFVWVTVKDIFDDERMLFVSLESDKGPLEDTPYIEDFCEEVNLVEILNYKPAA